MLKAIRCRIFHGCWHKYIGKEKVKGCGIREYDMHRFACMKPGCGYWWYEDDFND